ncbi:MAG: sugar-binding domain-containing protein, partial [Bosea sp. (in: a-proteobacteria)]
AVDLTDQSKALEYGVLSKEAWHALREAGAVGDVAGHYLDRAGTPVAHPIADRTIRMDLSDLRAINEIVLAAGGAHKVAIVRAAIAAHLCHVLITDEALASELLSSRAS